MLQQLCNFLKQQLKSQAYLFAHKKIELKQNWPDEIDVELVKLESSGIIDFHSKRKSLEIALIEHEMLVEVDKPLNCFLAKVYKSKQEMFKSLPLLLQLSDIFVFTGAHYVKLRQTLRGWIFKTIIPDQDNSVTSQWCWTFLYNCPHDLTPTNSSMNMFRLKI